MTSTSF